MIENPPSSNSIIYPPVTTQVGVPIVNIPGCVEANKDSSENENLKNEDKMVIASTVMGNAFIQSYGL